jgi:hypothetical protein
MRTRRWRLYSTVGALLVVVALTLTVAEAASAASSRTAALSSSPPIPIPGGLFVPNPFGGPDVHFHLPGPVDSATPDSLGGDPSTIDNFNGFVGVAHVEGTGTDNSGNTLFWDADLRFMKGLFLLSDGTIVKGAFGFI